MTGLRALVLLVTLASCGELAPFWEGSSLITIRLDGVYSTSLKTPYVIWWTPTFKVAAITALEAEDPNFGRDFRLYQPPPDEALGDFPRLGTAGRAAWGTAITIVSGRDAVPLVGEPGQAIGAKLNTYAPQPLFYFEDPTALPGGADYYHLPRNAAWPLDKPADAHLFVECPVDLLQLQNPTTTLLWLSLPPTAGASVLSTIAPSCIPMP